MLYLSENLENLSALIEKIKNQNFSIETQYKFLKISKVVDNELSIINEQKELLVKQFAEYDENGQILMNEDGGIKIKEESLNECLKKVIELNQITITFPDIYFSLSELENLGLTLQDLMYLEPFIKS